MPKLPLNLSDSNALRTGPAPERRLDHQLQLTAAVAVAMPAWGWGFIAGTPAGAVLWMWITH